MKTLANLAIAVAVAGSLYGALVYAEATTPGLEFGAVKFVLPMVLGSGLFTGLNRRSGNRRMPVTNGIRKAELLAFPPRAGSGWVVVLREKRAATRSLGFDVVVDRVAIAQLMPKRFTMIALPAGAHQLSVDVPGARGDFAVVPLDITVGADTVLIFAIRASMGLLRSPLRFDPVADTPALRATLAQFQLVEAQA
ncbi:hypothetical protein AB2M62_19090 [Sphingomonas sp. MMS12-HWE2-04]|uniref:hypothetical protein n=1 Tax=Sphingomonas sp. MMS12-HWE2-04 TaxID=3234199 RepID=UPI00384A7C5A